MSTPYPAESRRDFHGVLRDRGQVIIPPAPPRRIGGRGDLTEHAALLRQQLTALAAAEAAHLLMIAELNQKLETRGEHMSYQESELRLTQHAGAARAPGDADSRDHRRARPQLFTTRTDDSRGDLT